MRLRIDPDTWHPTTQSAGRRRPFRSLMSDAGAWIDIEAHGRLAFRFHRVRRATLFIAAQISAGGGQVGMIEARGSRRCLRRTAQTAGSLRFVADGAGFILRCSYKSSCGWQDRYEWGRQTGTEEAGP